MNIKKLKKLDRLPNRAKLLEYFKILGLEETDCIKLYDAGVFNRPENMAVIQTCYQKAWIKGTSLAPSDFDGLTCERLAVLKLLLAVLVPLISERHAELNLPFSITSETCLAIGLGVSMIAIKHIDAYIKNLSWAGKYYRTTLFKAGLFVYELADLSADFPAFGFYNRKTGQVQALMNGDQDINAQGLVCAKDMPPAFTTKLIQTETTVTGYQVTAGGRVSDEIVTLPKNEWEIVMAPSLCSAMIHIPAGRPMVLEDCLASMAQATGIIRQYFPGLRIKNFTCRSWILNPDWPELLPDSNLTRFMRAVYLFPIKSSLTAGVSFVFRADPDALDLKTAPRDTRLQRIMLEHLEQKKPLYAGGMFWPLNKELKSGKKLSL